MNKIKSFIKNISPFNNRNDMPMILYVIKVIIIFLVFKFGAELAGEGIVLALHFACGKNPLKGEMLLWIRLHDRNDHTFLETVPEKDLIGIRFFRTCTKLSYRSGSRCIISGDLSSSGCSYGCVQV